MPGATRSDLPDDAKGRGVIGAMGCVGRSANKDRCSCKIKDLSSMFQQSVAGQGPSTKSQGSRPRAWSRLCKHRSQVSNIYFHHALSYSPTYLLHGLFFTRIPVVTANKVCLLRLIC